MAYDFFYTRNLSIQLKMIAKMSVSSVAASSYILRRHKV
jgi:hypothetical protein